MCVVSGWNGNVSTLSFLSCCGYGGTMREDSEGGEMGMRRGVEWR